MTDENLTKKIIKIASKDFLAQEVDQPCYELLVLT